MGRRHRQREKLSAPTTEYRDDEAGLLRLRGSLTPGSRRRYSETLHGGLHREDARARAVELLFEHLAESWEIAGVQTRRPAELLARLRLASAAEREFVLRSLRGHVAEHFPELEEP
jgi:hypothetical protein